MPFTSEKIIISNDFDEFTPPYCYRYKLAIEFGDSLTADLEIKYYDREELDPEEIYAEGFSENDDFQWKGELPAVWKKEIFNLLEKAKQGKSKGNFQLISINKKEKQELVPKNIDQFEYLTQELIQGIYEISGKQEELSIELKDQRAKSNNNLSLTVSFHQRKAEIQRNNSSSEINWKTCQEMLQKLYSYPMDSFNTFEKIPNRKGVYINLGDGFWYEAGVSILPQKNKQDAEEKLLKFFEKLSNA